MKSNALFLCLFVLLMQNALFSQSISPSVSGEYCPNTDIVFTVSLPGTGYTNILPSGWATNVPATVVSGPSNITISSGNTVFNFTGRFQDVNNLQTFRVSFFLGGQSSSYDFTFSKIKSFFAVAPESIIQPTPSLITAQRCQTQNFNINFQKISFVNTFSSPRQVYGLNNSYEFLLPSGWQLNGTTSTGSNWISGTNASIITSDLSTGDGQFIQVRPVNDCGSSLIKGPISYISIQRPAASLNITGAGGLDYICSGTRDFSVNGLPSGSSVLWQISNSSLATIPANSNGSTVTVTKTGLSGFVTLTATVTHCSYVYVVTKVISLGTPPPTLEVYPNCPEATCLAFGPNATNYSWSTETNSGLQTYLYETSVMTFKRLSGSATICVSYTNACGTSIPTCNYIDCPLGEEHRLLLSPNPVKQYVEISSVVGLGKYNPKGETNESLIYEVKILNLSGRLVKRSKYDQGIKSLKLYVGDVAKGIYIISAFNKKEWISQKLIIQ